MRTKNPETFKAIEEFVNEYTERHGVSPTVREIHAGIGLAVGTVSRYLSYMRENGMIDYNGCRNITTREAKITKRETTRVPVLGAVSCGVPKFAEENIEEYVRLPVALFGKGDFFILRANGNSMIEANIDDGDLVVIKQQNYAEPGQIVVALMDDEATLKRYYPEPEKRRVRLHPENSTMRDIIVKDCIIVSRETWELAQQIREQRRNKKIAGSKKPVYPFTSMIECGCCGKHYQHKVNNSGKKWRNDIWACATQLRKGVAECDCTRLKDSALREQFIAAYNQFVRERPQGHDTAALQSVVAELRKEESDLAELLMQRLITESAFRAEQRRIKAQIEELNTKINEQRGKIVRESDFTIITEFDPEKVEKFITKVIVRRWTVTFVFYNGVEITRAYTNGPSGNQVGWNQKKEVTAWQ